jgi:hypothetical protein
VAAHFRESMPHYRNGLDAESTHRCLATKENKTATTGDEFPSDFRHIKFF